MVTIQFSDLEEQLSYCSWAALSVYFLPLLFTPLVFTKATVQWDVKVNLHLTLRNEVCEKDNDL